jgi:hypothetical protein
MSSHELKVNISKARVAKFSLCIPVFSELMQISYPAGLPSYSSGLFGVGSVAVLCSLPFTICFFFARADEFFQPIQLGQQ